MTANATTITRWNAAEGEQWSPMTEVFHLA